MDIAQTNDTKKQDALPGSLSFIQQGEKPVEDLKMEMVHIHVFSLTKQEALEAVTNTIMKRLPCGCMSRL